MSITQVMKHGPRLHHRFRLSVALCAALMLVSCSRGGIFGGGSKGSSGDGSLPAKHPEDPEKPGDQSEGIPGYLTDPSAVQVTMDPATHRAVAKGNPGAVARDKGKVEDTRVGVWVAKAADLKAAVKAKAATVKARFLGAVNAKADGSFSFEFPYESESDALIFSTTAVASADSVAWTSTGARTTSSVRWLDQPDKAPSMSPTELEAATNCGLSWGSGSPFQTPPAQGVRRFLATSSLNDDVDRTDALTTSEPEFVLVSVNAALNSTLNLDLANPKGWYCVTGDVGANADLDIRYDDSAHFAESGLKRGINAEVRSRAADLAD